MILTVDIGNTDIVLGVYTGEALQAAMRLKTNTLKTEDEYACDFMNIFNLYCCNYKSINGSIISSVVPKLKSVISGALTKLLHIRPVIVSHKLNTGFEIKTDFPEKLGADLICSAAAAKNKYTMPCVIFDLGTATTVTAMDSTGAVIGGAIIPGVNISLKALTESASQLPPVNIDENPVYTIGTSTVESMRTGIILGTACIIDGMTQRYKAELGNDAAVVITGGLSHIIAPYCKSKIVLDRDLVSEGLLLLYKMNC